MAGRLGLLYPGNRGNILSQEIISLIRSKGFDLAKYGPSKQWAATEWLRALSFRESVGYAQCLGADKTNRRRNRETLKENAESLIDAPLEHGEPVLDDPPIADQMALEFFDGVGAFSKDADYRAWHHALLNNFYEDIDDVPEFLGVASNRVFEIEQEVENTPAWRMHSQLEQRWEIELKDRGQWDHSHWREVPWKPFIKVNMLYSDEILINEFATWLREARSRLNSEYPIKKIKKPDIQTWYVKRYLPILDLKFWAVVNDVELSFEDLAELVFPDWVDANGEDGVDVDNVRKTHFRNALQLLAPSTLRSLGYLFRQAD